MNVTSVVLTGGASRRMGFPKALLEYEGETFLDRMIRLFSDVCSEIIVVTGYSAEAIRAGCKLKQFATWAYNERHELGMLSSLQCGLRAQVQTAPFLFTPVDLPLLQKDTIDLLLQSQPSPLRIPRYLERRGHPVYCAATLRDEFLSLDPTRSPRDVIEAHRTSVEYIDVNDRGTVHDVDDPATYRSLVASTLNNGAAVNQ